jgi:hypothetical protein
VAKIQRITNWDHDLVARIIAMVEYLLWRKGVLALDGGDDYFLFIPLYALRII